MIKVIRVNNSELIKKVEMICAVVFGHLSDNEVAVLAELINYSTNNQLVITADIAKNIKSYLGITDSLFSTCLNRMKNKGVYSKESKTVTLHPVFANLLVCEGIKIVF